MTAVLLGEKTLIIEMENHKRQEICDENTQNCLLNTQYFRYICVMENKNYDEVE